MRLGLGFRASGSLSLCNEVLNRVVGFRVEGISRLGLRAASGLRAVGYGVLALLSQLRLHKTFSLFLADGTVSVVARCLWQ